jgi:hypothetical protein
MRTKRGAVAGKCAASNIIIILVAKVLPLIPRITYLKLDDHAMSPKNGSVSMAIQVRV